ncbi:hypothetical protein F5Y19DRAFT_422433 [Xylariaceae sp. FL1651]|nr:hypothetical protein F5Y19DRAFT_422433 [Xylariaceae sp. FL1651]
MTVTRIFVFAIADPAAQEEAIKTFNGFKDNCKKDGATYIVAAHAAKCDILRDTTGSTKWTVFASLTFANQADADYWGNEDPHNQEVKKKGESTTSGFFAIQASFT